MKTKLLAVVGSLRRDSVTRCGVQHVVDAAKRIGAETELLDLRATRLSLYDPDSDDTPEYKQIMGQVNWANAFLLGSPDYHGGMSGGIKNFLDHFWREFAGKLFGYVCSSHEKGLTPMEQMRTAVRQCYGWSLPYGVSLSDADVDDAATKVTNARVAQRLNLMAYDLVTYAPLLQKQFEADVASKNPEAGFAVRYRK